MLDIVATITFFVSLALIAIFAMLGNSLLRVQKRTTYLILLYVWGTVHIVLVGQILGLLGGLNQPLHYIGVQSALVTGLTSAWFLDKRPALFPSRFYSDLSWQTTRQRIRRYPLLSMMIAVVFAMICAKIIIIVMAPLNLPDFVDDYAPRLTLWHSMGMIRPIDLPREFFPISSYPIVPFMAMYWWILFTDFGDAVGFASVFAMVAIAIGILQLARILGAPRPASILAGLVWLGWYTVFDFAGQGMTDMEMVAFGLIAITLLLDGLQEQNARTLFGSALSFGLFIGTKEVALMYLPGATFLGLALLWQYRTQWHLIIRWLLFAFVAVMLLGSYAYVANTVHYGSPFGQRFSDPTSAPSIETTDMNTMPSATEATIDQNRVGLRSIETIVRNTQTFVTFLAGDATLLFQDNHLIVYGLMLGGYVVLLVLAWRHRDPTRWGLLAFIVAFYAVLFAVRDTSAANERYALLVTAIGIASVAPIFSAHQTPTWHTFTGSLKTRHRLARLLFALFVVVHVLGLLNLWQHTSDDATLLGRYSVDYFVGLLGAHGVFGVLLLEICVLRLGRRIVEHISVTTLALTLTAFTTLVMITISSVHQYLFFLDVKFQTYIAILLITLNAYVAFLGFYHAPSPSTKPQYPVMSAVNVFFASLLVATALNAVLFVGKASLIGADNIWSIEPQTYHLNAIRADHESLKPSVAALNNQTDEDASLAIMLAARYPLRLIMGEDLKRPIAFVYPYPSTLDASWMREFSTDYLLLDANILAPEAQDALGINRSTLSEPSFCPASDNCGKTQVIMDDLEWIPLEDIEQRYWLVRLSRP